MRDNQMRDEREKIYKKKEKKDIVTVQIYIVTVATLDIQTTLA